MRIEDFLKNNPNVKKNLEKNVKRDEQGRILISKDDEWIEEKEWDNMIKV